MENISERKKNYMRRLEQLELRQSKQNLKSPRELIKEGVRKSTGITDEKAVDELSKRAIKAENVPQTTGYDSFFFGIAESLENIRCETSSQNEYFAWIDDAKKILDGMKDGCVTGEDIKEKEDFIEESWQREIELMTCLSLYEKSNNPLAKKRHAELLIKLQRLRQLRSALKVGTKNYSDKRPLSNEELSKIAKFSTVLNEMKNCDENGDYNNAVLRQHLLDLQIAHFDDIEFYQGYSFYTKMLEKQRVFDVCGSRCNNVSGNCEYRKSPDECLVFLRSKENTKETIQERIMRLSGRKKLSDDAVSKKYSERAFDANVFNYLRNKEVYTLDGK